MDTPLCNAGLDFDEFPITIDNRCVAPMQRDIAQSPDAPDRPIQDDRMHRDDRGRERSLAIAEKEPCVERESRD